jgi:hypothetical protein
MRKFELVALALIACAACSSGGSGNKNTAPRPVSNTVAASTTTTVPGTAEQLTFTGAITGEMTSAHPGPQTSDTLCTKGIWNFVGPVADKDYKVEMQMATGYKGPGTYSTGELTPGSGVSQIQLQVSESVGPDQTPPQYYVAVPGKVKLTVASDERSGEVDAELRPLQGADTNVHVNGQWACLPDS